MDDDNYDPENRRARHGQALREREIRNRRRRLAAHKGHPQPENTDFDPIELAVEDEERLRAMIKELQAG